MKSAQLQIVESFVTGHDVFGVLPTGYGKSLCYACLPSVFDCLLQKPSGFSIVLEPRKALSAHFAWDFTTSKQGVCTQPVVIVNVNLHIFKYSLPSIDYSFCRRALKRSPISSTLSQVFAAPQAQQSRRLVATRSEECDFTHERLALSTGRSLS